MYGKYKYNDFIGHETLEIEYKIASLNMKGTGVTDSHAVELIKSNEFIFNDSIINNLSTYVNYYFLKYFTGFLNQNNQHEIKKPKIMIGVNDYGFVSGIPFKGELNIDFLKKICESNITNNNIISNIDKDTLSKLYQIKLIKIDYQPNKTKDYYKMYLKQELENKKLMNKYYSKFKLMNKMIKKYATKLTNIILNEPTRSELLEFIWNRVEFKYPMIYFKIKKQINDKSFPMNPDHNDIQIYKEDVYSVYYWVTRFKDEMIDFYRTMKPEKPILSNKIYPNNMISIIENMIPNWMNCNSDMNLYIIQIDFFPEKIKKIGIEDYYIKYVNPFNNSISYCLRDLDYQGNPCCQPM